MLDMSLIIAGLMHELRKGSCTAYQLREIVESGKLAIDVHLFTDSYSIFSYVRAQHLKYPADKGTFYHLAYLRECVEKHRAKGLHWIDTRDMLCDGMTKGKIDREALTRAMQGYWSLKHKHESYCP